MLLYLLIAQRNVSYPGEFGMETLAVISEYDKEGNEAYIPDTYALMLISGEFERLAWVTATVNENEIDARLEKDNALDWHGEPRPKGQYGVRVLFALRNGRYPGEYGLEALTAMDEYALSDNPDYLQEQAQEAIKSKDFSSLGYVDIGLDQPALKAMLYPESVPLCATLL